MNEKKVKNVKDISSSQNQEQSKNVQNFIAESLGASDYKEEDPSTNFLETPNPNNSVP